MAHKMGKDDNNIIELCRNYKFCCTYDSESDFSHESVTDAIARVLESRAEQSKKLDGFIARASELMKPLQELIASAEKLAKNPGSGIGTEENHQNEAALCQNQLIAEENCLKKNLRTLEETKIVMERKNIRVPVVGVINSGKSTFLHSALGNGERMNDRIKENLFPSANGLKSCTGTRTVLIYDDTVSSVKVDAKFKDKHAFCKDCKRSVSRMIEVLKDLNIADQYKEIYKLKTNFSDNCNPIDLLKEFYLSTEFTRLCTIPDKNEGCAESVHDFCSFVYFAMDQDYLEEQMSSGIHKENFTVRSLINSWDQGNGCSVQVPSDDDFAMVKSFVCKYDPQSTGRRYTTYCGVQVVEIRGNLCGEIAGLELIDSVGANDVAISPEEQARTLMQESDAMILLERPQPQKRGGWSITDWVRFVEKQNKEANQFLYLVYNCYNNNIVPQSELYQGVEQANRFYSRNCKKVYVSDIGEWEEVQSKMLVDVLVNLSRSVKETHKEYLNLAKDANANIAKSISSICRIAENLKQVCVIESENASEKKQQIEAIIRRLFGKIEKLAFDTRLEQETKLSVAADKITENLVNDLMLCLTPDEFVLTYEYLSPTGPRYMYNRYAAFLCMYSHMLEDVKRKYSTLRTQIDSYVGEKRQKLLNILWEDGRFQCIMSDLGDTNDSMPPKAEEVCGWLKRDSKDILAAAFQELLLQDIGTESLIDGTIGKIIERFEQKNLTTEQLFGQRLSDPSLENDEERKAKEVGGQLLTKAEELKADLKATLPESVIRNAEAVQGTGAEQRNMENRDDAEGVGEFLKRLEQQRENARRAEEDPSNNANTSDMDENVFDLDQRVRNDVVCAGILKKFRDKLRGDGLSQNVESPMDQLYNLYDRHYDKLLSQEEVSKKQEFINVCNNTDELAGQLIELCQNI